MALGRLLLQPALARFIPTDIPDLKQFLNACFTATLFQDSVFTITVDDDGDVVGGQQDKSGNSIDVIQATVANKPTFDATEQAVQADGVNDELTGAQPGVANGDYSIYLRYKPDSAGGAFQMVFSISSSSSPTPQISIFHEKTAQEVRFNHKDDASNELDGGSFDTGGALDDDWNTLGIRRNGGTWTVDVNGTIGTSTNALIGTTTVDQSRVFASRTPGDFMTGFVKSVIVYGRNLNDSEDQQVRNYLDALP